jgi:hypothetical protein
MPPPPQVAILGIAAAGVGLTLTAASTVLFAELSWVPGQIMQVCIGGGEQESVFCFPALSR